MILLLAALLASTPVSFPSCKPGKAGTLNCLTRTVDVAEGEKSVTYKAPAGYILKKKGARILQSTGKATIEASFSKDRKQLTCRWKASKSSGAGVKSRVK